MVSDTLADAGIDIAFEVVITTNIGMLCPSCKDNRGLTVRQALLIAYYGYILKYLINCVL